MSYSTEDIANHVPKLLLNDGEKALCRIHSFKKSENRYTGDQDDLLLTLEALEGNQKGHRTTHRMFKPKPLDLLRKLMKPEQIVDFFETGKGGDVLVGKNVEILAGKPSVNDGKTFTNVTSIRLAL
jgi:hypothetical protein